MMRVLKMDRWWSRALSFRNVNLKTLIRCYVTQAALAFLCDALGSDDVFHFNLGMRDFVRIFIRYRNGASVSNVLCIGYWIILLCFWRQWDCLYIADKKGNIRYWAAQYFFHWKNPSTIGKFQYDRRIFQNIDILLETYVVEYWNAREFFLQFTRDGCFIELLYSITTEAL